MEIEKRFSIRICKFVILDYESTKLEQYGASKVAEPPAPYPDLHTEDGQAEHNAGAQPSTPDIGQPPDNSRGQQRRTRQMQEAIGEIIRDLPRGVHLTAPEVYRRAREIGLEVSLSTVYRILGLMQADGNVTTLAGDHGRRYEARDLDHDHDHLICVKCGYTVEFSDDLIRGFGKAVAERKGYEHKSSRFDILGICSPCKAKDEDHKIAACIDGIQTAKNLLVQSLEKLNNAATLLENRKLAKAQEILLSGLPQLKDASAEAEAAVELLFGES
ncbi:MAG TPA: transcriptional repressor [Candidatus Obscuribacterales bacterium]